MITEVKTEEEFFIKDLKDFFRSFNLKAKEPFKLPGRAIVILDNSAVDLTIDATDIHITRSSILFLTEEQVLKFNQLKDFSGSIIFFTDSFYETYGVGLNFLKELSLFFNCDNIKIIKLSLDFRKKVDEIINEMELEYFDGKLHNKMLFAGLITNLMIQLSRCRDWFKTQKIYSTNNTNQIVKNFKELVDREYRNLHNVADYAEILSITSKHLGDVIKDATGRTAREFISDRIILEAERLMLHTDKTLKEITFELGYKDITSLRKLLSRNTGRTYTETKESQRKNVPAFP